MSTYGKRLLQDRWTGHEHDVMARLWRAGLAVPYPLSYGDDVFDMGYLGTIDGAAPQLQAARLGERALRSAYEQLRDGLRTMTAAGVAHGDLSAEERDAYFRRKREGAAPKLAKERRAEFAAQEQFLLTVRSDGFGKRTSSHDYRLTRRGGKGIIRSPLASAPLRPVGR